MKNNNLLSFLPISRKEMEGCPDFVCITGDAYVDHPSFGVAIISRILESCGFSVGIIAQPKTDRDFMEFGAPKYGFMVSGGNVDSMVSNYTVSGKRRYKDDYSPGGKNFVDGISNRPDYAVNVYCQTLRRLFANTGIIIGGLEASLRRFAHYDYWSDSVLPSVLVSSGADLLIYGMAELTLIQMAWRLKKGESLCDIKDLRGTCYIDTPQNTPINAVQCDSFKLVSENKKCYAVSCRKQYDEQDEVYGKTIVQRHEIESGETGKTGSVMLIQNPPQRSLSESEMDKIYALPFTRKYHDIYESMGGVPAIREVEFSITWTRGCFGFCNFCSIALHQGRRIQTRSKESVLNEAASFINNIDFKGYISDIGGPTANFGHPSCEKQIKHGMCKRKCLAPTPCKNIDSSHDKYLSILRGVRGIDGIKRVFIRSGIRYDYLMIDEKGEFFDDLVRHHVSGQLKIAPEHIKQEPLRLMGKPPIKAFETFCCEFNAKTKRAKKEQYLVPYLMSSHPGATLDDAVDLAIWLKKRNIRPEQVQDFYPTPGTISTAMYYTGLDVYTLKPIYVAKSPQQKAIQRALLQYYKPENRALVEKALKLTNKTMEGGKNVAKKRAESVKKSGKTGKNSRGHKLGGGTKRGKKKS